MIIPFSFWGADKFSGIAQVLQQSENFTGWFTQWAAVVQASQQTENFTNYLNAPWVPVVQTSQQTENFNAW